MLPMIVWLVQFFKIWAKAPACSSSPEEQHSSEKESTHLIGTITAPDCHFQISPAQLKCAVVVEGEGETSVHAATLGGRVCPSREQQEREGLTVVGASSKCSKSCWLAPRLHLSLAFLLKKNKNISDFILS